MILRALVRIGALLLLATLGWSLFRQPAVRAWVWPEQHKPRPIVFDNGTVRQLPEPSQTGAPPMPPGRMRRCQRGTDTRYTDQPCPPGFREQAVGGVINVLDAEHSSAAAVPASKASDPARKNLYDALDLNGRDDLMQRRIDRSVEQATR